MKTYLNLTWMQFKLLTREPVALFFTVAFPVLLLLLFGSIFGNEIDPLYGGQFGYIDAEVPGLAAIIIGTVGLISIPVATANAREQKILRRYQATPLRPMVYLAADITVQLLNAVLGLVALVILGLLFFDLRFGGNWLYVLMAVLLSGLAFSAVGYLVASLSPTSRVAQVVGQVIFFPMMFLSGATLPVQIMPEGVRTVSQFLPLTHVVALLQDLWFGNGWNMTAILILVVMLLGGSVLSAAVFRWE